MRIKTWKAWHDPVNVPTCVYHSKHRYYPSPCRIVPETTWKKVMAVVNAADDSPWDGAGIMEAADALREHERKRK